MSSPYSFDVSDTDFMQNVIEASMQTPVLVDFWATWCQPCQILKPLLEKIADANQGRFLLAKVNTEENQQIAMQFGIRSIPAVKLFINGEVVDEFMGALPENDILAFLDKNIPRESDALVDQADTLLSEGDLESAMDIIKQANQMDPANTRVLVTYAKICVAQGNHDEAKAVIQSLSEDLKASAEIVALQTQMEFAELTADTPSAAELQQILLDNPDDHDSRYKLAALQISTGEVESALDNLLVIMQKDRNYQDDAARKLMLKIFDALGADSPLVTIYRRKMMNLMF